jgi:hypothetical protein
MLACGGSTEDEDVGSSGDDDAESGSVPLEQMPTRLASVSCELQFECCPSQVQNNPLVGSSAEDCTVTVGAFLTLFVASLQASISAGRAAYDGALLGRCIDQLSAAGCTADPNQLTGCTEENAFIRPLVEPGGECTQAYECKSGTCLGAGSTLDETAPTSTGKCATALPEGSACSDDAECVSGRCDFFEEVCAPLAAMGESCFSDSECASDTCGDDGTCAAASSSSSICE